MLEELGIGTGATVSVSRRRKSDFKQEELLDKGGLNERARQAFSEIFGRFSTEGQMTTVQCTAFARAVSGGTSANEKSVSFLFDKFGQKGCDYITLEQFLKFYEDAARNKTRTVWDNLLALGYRPDLRRFDDNSGIVQIPSEKLPRYLLSNTPKYFTLLFDIFSTVLSQNRVGLEGEVSEAAWELIVKLCPNVEHANFVLHMLDQAPTNWDAALPLKDPHVTSYRLFLASALMLDVAPEEAALFKHEFYDREIRRTWKARFIAQGGLQYVSQVHLASP